MNRKLLSLLLALTFVFSMSVSVSATSSGSADASGEGTTAYVDTEIYDVVVPTSNNFNFTLDPQGLLSAVSGQSLSSLEGGKVIGMDSPQPFINNSAVPILITASAIVSATGTVTFVDDPLKTSSGAIKSDVATDTSIALYIVPSTKNMPVTGASIAFDAATGGFLLTSTAGTGAEAVNLQFALPAADYTTTVVTPGSSEANNYGLEFQPGTGHGNAIQIGGFMNSGANWKKYADTDYRIGVDFVFSWEKDTTPVADHTYYDTGLGLTSASYLVTDNVSIAAAKIIEPEDAGKTYNATGFIVNGDTQQTLVLTYAQSAGFKPGGDVAIPFYLKSGETATAVWATSTNLTSGTDYTISNNVLTIKLASSTFGTPSTGSTNTKTVKITAGGKTYTATFFLYPVS